MAIALSKITSETPLSKGFAWKNAAIQKIPGGSMYGGSVERLHICDLRDLSRIIQGLTTHQALTFGTVALDGQHHTITTASKQKDGLNIARTRQFFAYPQDAHGILLLDYDPPKDDSQPLTADALISTLQTAVPSLAGCEMLVSSSESSHIYRTDTGDCLKGAGGLHLFVTVANASDIPAIGQAVASRCWLAGLGRVEKSKSGAALLRTLVDESVWQPERLSFDAGAACGQGLEQRRPEHHYRAGRALSLDDVALTPTEQNEVKHIQDQARGRLGNHTLHLDQSQRGQTPSCPAKTSQRVPQKRPPIKIKGVNAKMRKVINALESIPPDCDYVTWIAIGMALRQGFGTQGFTLWDVWSSAADNYPGKDALWKKYQSFGGKYAGREITLGSLFHYAHQYGWEPDNTRALWPVRTAKKPLPVAAGMDLVSARSKAQKIVDKVVAVAKKRAEAFSRYREELNAYNAEREKSQKENKKCKAKKAKKPKRPHFPPLNVGAQLFTGVGKTHLFEQLIQRLKALDIPTVIVALNKKAAEQYAAAGAFWRQGREDLSDSGGFSRRNHCPKMGYVTTLGEQEHTIAAEMCNAWHCEHGVARAAKKPFGGMEPQVIQFYKEHPEARKAEPCVFLDHLDDASKETVIVLTSQALSPGELTTKDGRPRMVIVDEDFPVAHITSATATDLTGYLAAIQGVSVHIRADLDRLSTFTGKNVEDRQADLRRELEKLQLMTDVFNDLGQCIGGLLHTDGNPVIPQNLNQLAAKMQGTGPMGKAQSWEKPVWERWTDLDRTPLRTAGELMDSIQKGTLRIVDGALKIPYVHPIVNAARHGDMPILFADATLSPEVRSLILSTDGEIYKIVGQYQKPVIYDPRWYHAQLNPNDADYAQNLKNEAENILIEQDQISAQTGVRAAIIANRPKTLAALALRCQTTVRDLEKLDKKALWDLTIQEGLGWWGWHETAHDHWNGWNVKQWDQPALPEDAKRDRVLAFNGLMGIVGGDALPEYTSDHVAGLWVTTGAEEQQSRSRLHKDPQIRAFLQEITDARRIQAMGRGRLALHPECQAYILGGTPPASLAAHGYAIEYRRVIQAYSGDEKSAVTHQKRIRQLDEAAIVLINSGETLTNHGLQEQCRKVHGSAPRNETVTEWMATRGPILAEFCSKYGRNAKKHKAVIESIAERMGPHATMTLDLLLEMLEAGLEIAAAQALPPTHLDEALQEALRQACAADHPDDHMRYAMRRAAVEIFRRHVIDTEAAPTDPPLAQTG